MRIRAPFRRRRGAVRPIGFAWLPKRMHDGTVIWLERYRRVPTDRGQA